VKETNLDRFLAKIGRGDKPVGAVSDPKKEGGCR